MIVADIPLSNPDLSTHGYSRGGRWHAVFQSGSYVNTDSPAEIIFTERQLRLHQRKALESIREESKMERPTIDLKRAMQSKDAEQEPIPENEDIVEDEDAVDENLLERGVIELQIVETVSGLSDEDRWEIIEANIAIVT